MEDTERFYCNEKLIQKISAALTILFNNKNPVMKVAVPYTINIKLEKNLMEINISETSGVQSQGKLQRAASSPSPPTVKSVNNTPSPSPASSNKIESKPTPVFDPSSMIILKSQNISFFTPFIRTSFRDNAAAIGVGDIHSDFWIGFDQLYNVMRDQRYALRIVHTLEDGSKRDATYDDFRLRWNGRAIHSLGKFTGSSRDYLRIYEKQPPILPPWFAAVCTMKLDPNSRIKSSIMLIKPWPGRF